MLTKTFTYIDYNGKERTETAYFNLNKAEMMEMEMSTSNGFSEMIQKLIEEEDHATIVKIFKDIILKSYGVKSEDGRRFIKSKELSDNFSMTEAYPQLFMELATDSEAAAAFVNGIISDNASATETNSSSN